MRVMLLLSSAMCTQGLSVCKAAAALVSGSALAATALPLQLNFTLTRLSPYLPFLTGSRVDGAMPSCLSSPPGCL